MRGSPDSHAHLHIQPAPLEATGGIAGVEGGGDALSGGRQPHLPTGAATVHLWNTQTGVCNARPPPGPHRFEPQRFSL